MNKNINENDLGDRMATGISYGTSGIVNPGVSTYASPDVSQHPINFYPVGQNKIDSYNSMRVTGPDQKDIDFIKNKVTPDEILAGLDYELKRMFYKNKSHAKQMVVDNLKKDPKYYSKLNMLNIEDNFMKENKSHYKKMAESLMDVTNETVGKSDNIYISKSRLFDGKRKYFGSFVDFDEVIKEPVPGHVVTYILNVDGHRMVLQNVSPDEIYWFKSEDGATFTGDKLSAEEVKSKINKAVSDVKESKEDDIDDLKSLLKNPDVEFANKNYGSVEAYKNMLQNKIDKLEGHSENLEESTTSDKKEIFKNIFDDMINKNVKLNNRNVDERVVNAYRQTQEKIKNRKNRVS